MLLDNDFLNELLEQATNNPRLRQSYDLRTSAADTSQRMLNAMQPGTEVPIHRHEDTTETMICLHGTIDVVIYEPTTDNGGWRELQRTRLCQAQCHYGFQIPQGAWHSVEVVEPSVIFEAKDGAYKA